MAVTTLKTLTIDQALDHVDGGAAFIDLRNVDDYLDVHVPESLPLIYEFGPGMAGRARDCLPLDLPLVLLDPGGIDCVNAAASLRGKGFTVVGAVEDGVNAWAGARGAPASTEVVEGDTPPKAKLLHVGDPGAPDVDGSVQVPIEALWARREELATEGVVAVVSGYGVRAALAVGILERAGVEQVIFWRAS